MSLNWAGNEVAANTLADFPLNSGVFHRVHKTVTPEGANSRVSMSILPDVFGAGGDAIQVFDNVLVPGLDLNTLPDFRLIAGGRTGGAFHDGDLDHGLRDLIDLHDLLEYFGTSKVFWETLVPRAVELDLARPLTYGLVHCRELLGTSIPNAVIEEATVGRPGRCAGAIMSTLANQALVPHLAGEAPLFKHVATFLLFVRSHYLRMPLYLLVPHLLRKSWSRLRSGDQ